MTELDADAVIDEYVRRHPAAQRAVAFDPAFQMQMESLRRTIDLLVPALRREGLDPMAARRVVNTIVYGVPDPDASIMRMAERDVQIAKAMTEPITFHVPAELAASLNLGELPGGDQP